MTGFDAAEVDELLNEFYAKEAVEDNFDVDAAHEDVKAKGAITKRGDIWKLGDHLLMCGDSTKPDDIAKLMGKERAQVAVTSPPYGVGKEYEKKGIEPWLELVQPVIKNITKYADSGGRIKKHKHQYQMGASEEGGTRGGCAKLQ